MAKHIYIERLAKWQVLRSVTCVDHSYVCMTTWVRSKFGLLLISWSSGQLPEVSMVYECEQRSASAQAESTVYSEGGLLESRPEHRLSSGIVFVDFVSTFMHILL